MKQPIYAPGTMIAGRYRIDRPVARGGCSIVYEGTHVDMQRTVALKIMSVGGGAVAASWTKRFQREAQLASLLRHPNTIVIYDYGHDDGIWYIVMEWVEGASLRNAIRDAGPIEPERAARLSLQLLASLSEAHRAKVLHRDLKPSNIMVTSGPDGREMIKVLDFGLAKAELSDLSGENLKLTRDGDFVGTPRYASPEQLRGEALDATTDIYGVGMVLWEMLVGEPAVAEIDFAACLARHLSPTPWRLPVGAAPPGLAAIIERALDKERAARWPNCETMSEAIAAWLERPAPPEPVAAREPHVVAIGEALDDLMPLTPRDEIVAPAARSLPPGPVGAPRAPGRPKLSTERRVAELRADEITLDRARRPRRRSGAVTTSPHSLASHHEARAQAPGRSSSTLIGALALLVCVLAAGFLILALMRSQGQGPASSQKSFPVVGPAASRTAEVEIARARIETRSAESVLDALRQAGWSLRRVPGGGGQRGGSSTKVRASRGDASVEVSVLESASLDEAERLERDAPTGTSAVRLGFTVLWIDPVGAMSRAGAADIAALFAPPT